MTAHLLSFNTLAFPSSLTTIKSMNGFSAFISPKTRPPPFHQSLRLTHLYYNAYNRPSAVPTNPKSYFPLPCSRITNYFVPHKSISHILLPSDALHKPNSQALRAAADTPQYTNPEADLSSSKNKTLKLAVISGLWYFQSIVFNIYAKKVLNVFPFPWFLASFQLLIGSIWMFLLWSLKLQPCPRISKDFILALLGPRTLPHHRLHLCRRRLLQGRRLLHPRYQILRACLRRCLLVFPWRYLPIGRLAVYPPNHLWLLPSRCH